MRLQLNSETSSCNSKSLADPFLPRTLFRQESADNYIRGGETSIYWSIKWTVNVKAARYGKIFNCSSSIGVGLHEFLQTGTRFVGSLQ
jgi:hypothetical protein